MTNRAVGCWLALLAMLVNTASPVLAQGVVAPAPQPTLWSFLGIPQAFKAVREGGINRSGNHPALEKKPPLKKIADPANLVSENPAIKKAAEIKKEEDLKWQKIKAIKYLTTIGCGCYNRDGSITDALMKAMDDCTEEVRYATILAINGAAGGEMCENCKMRSCCSEEVSNKLYELAYEKDADGCFLEPSERVRLAAAEAIRVCCPGRGDDFFTGGAPVGEVGPPIGEQPGITPLPSGERPLDAPPVPLPSEPTPAPPLPPAPMPTLRPISEPVQARPEFQRQEQPRDPVARQEVLPQQLPRIAVRLPEPPRVAALPPTEIPQAPAAMPAIVQGASAPAATAPIVVRPAAIAPITTPAQALAARAISAQPAASKAAAPAAAPSPAPAPPPAPAPASATPAPPISKQPHSSRRTANLPAASPSPVASAAEKEKAASPSGIVVGPQTVAGKTPVTTASQPQAGSTPHWTVGSKAPTVFISKPIEPAKPITPAAKAETKDSPGETARPAAAPLAGQSQMAAQAPEILAPIVPAAAMRRLPPTDDATLPAPASDPTARREATPVSFISRDAPPSQPIEASKQRREIPGAKFGTGTIGSVRLRDGVAMIEFDSSDSVPNGSIIRAYHEYAFAARKTVGDLQVIRTDGHVAIAVPYNGSELAAFTVGDQAIVLR